MDRLLDDDTSEIADDARATIPRLHHLWCGTARRFDLTIDDSDEEGDSDEGDGFAALVHGNPLSGTRQGAFQDLGVDLHHAVKVFDLFAEWMVLCEASISSVVPPLGAR